MSVFCGQCDLEFKNDAELLAHVCEKTGVVLTDPLAMGANYATIQEAALERGATEG